MSEVEHVSLGHLSEIAAGPSGTLLENMQDGSVGVPVISPPDLSDQQTVDARRLRRVPMEDAKKLSRFALREGDILIVRQGALGRLALIRTEQASWFYSSSCLRIRPRRDLILPEYLTAFLSYPSTQSALMAQAIPGTVASMNSAILGDLSIAVPPLGRQWNIVETLADIDGRITIQKALVERLEVLRPAIFGEMIYGSSNT